MVLENGVYNVILTSLSSSSQCKVTFQTESVHLNAYFSNVSKKRFVDERYVEKMEENVKALLVGRPRLLQPRNLAHRPTLRKFTAFFLYLLYMYYSFPRTSTKGFVSFTSPCENEPSKFSIHNLFVNTVTLSVSFFSGNALCALSIIKITVDKTLAR